MDDPQQQVEAHGDERHDGQRQEREAGAEAEHPHDGEDQEERRVHALHDRDADQHADGVEVGSQSGHQVADARVVEVVAVEAREVPEDRPPDVELDLPARAEDEAPHEDHRDRADGDDPEQRADEA